MDIIAVEAGYNSVPHDRLGIFVGSDWKLAKACGGVKLARHAAERQREIDIDLIVLIIEEAELTAQTLYKGVALMHDPGEETLAEELCEKVRRAL